MQKTVKGHAFSHICCDLDESSSACIDVKHITFSDDVRD